MNNYLREEHLYPRIMKFVNNRGYITSREVKPHLLSSRRIDVVGVKPRKREVVTVEAKVSNYSSVLVQATRNLSISDYVYVSFPQTYGVYILEKYGRYLYGMGIGIIGVNGRSKELLPARQSTYVDLERKNMLMQMALGSVNNNEQTLF